MKRISLVAARALLAPAAVAQQPDPRLAGPFQAIDRQAAAWGGQGGAPRPPQWGASGPCGSSGG